MNKELKQRVINLLNSFESSLDRDSNQTAEFIEVLDLLTRKRGRVKGKKYPCKTKESSEPRVVTDTEIYARTA